MVTLNAHLDGKTIVVDEPEKLPFPSGAKLRVTVEQVEALPQVSPTPRALQPLNIHIDRELAEAIALDPEFNIEES